MFESFLTSRARRPWLRRALLYSAGVHLLGAALALSWQAHAPSGTTASPVRGVPVRLAGMSRTISARLPTLPPAASHGPGGWAGPVPAGPSPAAEVRPRARRGPPAPRARRNLLAPAAPSRSPSIAAAAPALPALRPSAPPASPVPPPTAPSAPATLLASVAQGLRIHESYPSLPADLAGRRGEYPLTFEICVSSRGLVQRVTVSEHSAPSLEQALVAALSGWRYRPWFDRGLARPFCHHIRIVYKSG